VEIARVFFSSTK